MVFSCFICASAFLFSFFSAATVRPAKFVSKGIKPALKVHVKLPPLSICSFGLSVCLAEGFRPAVGDGTPETNRTSDLPLRRGLLYPLSYRGVVK